MNLLDTFRALRARDQRRESAPGEHWAAFASGLTLLMRANRQRSRLGRTLALLGGGALVMRAASGRDGLAKWLAPSPRPDDLVADSDAFATSARQPQGAHPSPW